MCTYTLRALRTRCQSNSSTQTAAKCRGQSSTSMEWFVFQIMLLVAVLVCRARYPDELSTQRVKSISKQIHMRLQKNTNFSHLQETYNANASQGTVVSGKCLVNTIATELTSSFERGKVSLQNTAREVEHQYRMNSSSGCCSEVCVSEHPSHKDCSRVCSGTSTAYQMASTQTGTTLEYQHLFGHNVSFNDSTVHIPIDIFVNDPSVSCFVEWTAGLQDHFIGTWNSDTVFQFFGSNVGLLRFYPAAASEWSLLNQCYRCPFEPTDTFDARRRPWYMNTVPGSKFVVILLDVSGSMVGFQSVLARLAVTELLTSLTPNDYFFVIQVGRGEARPLGCFSKTRASPENVLVMKHVVMTMDDNFGRAYFPAAVDMAFEALNNSSECHKVIVVFTDGDGVGLKDNFDMSNANKEVRLFTYLIGRGSNHPRLKTVACSNRGNMKNIRDYSDIFREIGSLIDDLRSVIPQAVTNTEVFYSLYQDVFRSLVLTGSLPVRATVDNSSREFLGVVGIDIKPDTILSKYNVGVGGYGFLVDNNGQLVAHPHIDEAYIRLLSSDDLVSLEVSNFEHAFSGGDFQIVRNAMVGRETGQKSLLAWTTIQRQQQHYHLENVTYFYAPINGTPFSVAIVLPTNKTTVLQYANLSQDILLQLYDKTESAAEQEIIVLDNKMYCQWELESFSLLLNLICQLANDSCPGQEEPLDLCEPTLYWPVLNDLWYSSADAECCEDVRGSFMQFVSGLTRCSGEIFMNRSEEGLSCSDLPNYTPIPDDTNKVYIKVYITAAPARKVYVLAIRSLALRDTTAGVVGVVMATDDLSSILQTVINDTATNESVYYLVEDTGYIAGSTGDDMVGKLFSDVHPLVYGDLVTQNVFSNATVRGYELRPCDILTNIQTAEESCDSAATSLYQGLLISLFQWIVDGTLWSTLRLAILSGQVLGDSDGCHGINLCLKQIVIHHLEEGPFNISESLLCTNGEWLQYHAISVPDTNLLLVSVDNTTQCEQTETPKVDKDIPYPLDTCPEYPLPCLCSCEDCQMYRRSLDDLYTCYDNATVYDGVCSSAHKVQFTLLLLLLHIVIVPLYWIISDHNILHQP